MAKNKALLHIKYVELNTNLKLVQYFFDEKTYKTCKANGIMDECNNF